MINEELHARNKDETIPTTVDIFGSWLDIGAFTKVFPSDRTNS